MKRLILVLGLVCGVLLATPTAAHACSCVQRTPAEQTNRADTVLEGTVAWVSTNQLETTYGVDVASVYKGQSASFEKLRTTATSASCGVTGLVVNQRYLFLAQGEHPGQMKIDACGGTAAYSNALDAQISAVTGEPGGPQFTQLDRTGPIDEDPIMGTSIWNIFGTVAAVGIALWGMLWLSKRS